MSSAVLDRPMSACPGVSEASRAWHACSFLTCSVLPVRVACDLGCRFCFSKSSISALRHEPVEWPRRQLESYYAFARRRGARRMVVTGGGEPLLRPRVALDLVEVGRSYFEEIALFTNGSFLTPELARALRHAGLSYLCYSRHHHDDERNRELMGEGAVSLSEFFTRAEGLKVRATCVMCRGFVDSPEEVRSYAERLSSYGVRELTFKHTYVAYDESLFGDSCQNRWVREHQIESDPFGETGEVVGTLPWGPRIRKIGDLQVCYYYEPTPHWELANRTCRSSNLLSDGSVFASLEDRRSLLFRLSDWPAP